MPIKSSEILPFLPIEYLKWWPERYVPHAVKVFKSSGTGKTSRSASRFSDEGLTRYEAACVAGFRAALGHFNLNLNDTRGISLIPSHVEWPDSSLAHMLSTLARHCNVAFLKSDQLQQYLYTTRADERPLWLFATNYQWLSMSAAGQRFTLPASAIVFETGGSKGLSEEYSIADVKRRIAALLSIPTAQVVSEYGMCELASQAYDLANFAGHPTYRFDHGVKLQVSDERDQLHSEGRGCLVIHDPHRIDLPQPLRTQDDVTLFPDQSFVLHGRLLGAPIKGCSLSTADLVAPPGWHYAKAHENEKKGWTYDEWQQQMSARVARYRVIREKLVPTLHQENNLLAQEFSSAADAQNIIAAIAAAVPQDDKQWESALGRACFANIKTDRVSYRWLFIPPHNHSIAMLYPLFMAIAAGFEIHVRLPPLGKQGLAWLHQWLQCSADIFPDQLRLVPAHVRLGDTQADLEAIDRVFVFASNDTIANLRTLSPRPLQAFGEKICFAVCTSADIKMQIDQIARDAFAMQQRGCMSLRWIYVIEEGISFIDLQSFSNDLSEARIRYTGSCSTAPLKTALFHEAKRYRETTTAIPYLSNDCLIVDCQHPGLTFAPDLLSTAPGVLIVQRVTREDFMRELPLLLAQHSALNLALYTENIKSLLATNAIETRVLGQAHQYAWDGVYEGRGLFAY